MADDHEILDIASDEEDEMDCHVIENNETLAEIKKLEGNVQYQKKNYREALQLYSQAIELCPNLAAYYTNRSACLIMLARYKDALEDSRHAIGLDSNFVKAYVRASKCYVALGDPTAAIHSIDRAQEIDTLAPVQAELQAAQAVQFYEKEAQQDFVKGDFRKVIFCMDRALEHAVACRRYKVLKAECLALLGRYQESQEIANEILQVESINADAMYVKGLCLYYQDNIDKAFTHFQQVLRLSPDHCKAQVAYRKARSLKNKKEEGNTAFKLGDFQKAYTLYSEALAIDPFNRLTNAKLYCNRATVCSKINKLDQAIEDCIKALELDENYIKAYMRRAKCYMDKEQFEEAVKDYEKIYNMEKNRENKRLLQDAKLELKKSKRKDYYKILGITRNATDDDIKKAYRKRALVHHPDRHTGESPEKQKEEERKFKEVGEAYGILSDPKKRARYDNGQDLDDGLSEMDPNNIFQAFFGNSGFTFGPEMNGFPGGFTFHYG